MRPIVALYRKEVKSYALMPFFYVVSGLYIFLLGWIFFNNLVMAKNEQSFSFHENLIPAFFGNMNFLLMVLIPLLGTKLIAEEKKNKTLPLLMNSYLTENQIIFAKWLGALTVISVLIIAGMLFPLLLSWSGKVDWSLVVMGFLGTLMNAMLFLAVSLFCSTLTQHMILACLMSFVGVFILLLLGQSPFVVSNPLVAQMLYYLSVPYHFEPFPRGLLRSFDFLYYFGGVFIFLYASREALAAERW